MKYATSRPGVYYGWLIVATTFWMAMLAGGGRSGFGVFVIPMCEELGWSRGTISLAAALMGVVTSSDAATFGAVVPIGGHASDIALDESRWNVDVEETRNSLARHWPGDDVTTNDDEVDRGAFNVPKHGVKRGQVAVDVVDRRDPHGGDCTRGAAAVPRKNRPRGVRSRRRGPYRLPSRTRTP